MTTLTSIAQDGKLASDKQPIAEQAKAVFKKRCVSCHGQSQARGGLDMTSLESIRAGSNSGVVIEPGKPQESLVYTLADHQDTPKMPPNAPRIPQRELNAISAWIESLAEARSEESGDAAPTAMMANSMTAKSMSAGGSVSKSLVQDGIVPITVLEGPMALTALASSGSLVAVSGFHQVLLFDSELAQWRGALNFPTGDVFVLKFTEDGTRLLAAGGVGGQSGSVICWDTKSWRQLANISVEGDLVLAMDVSPDGKTIAVGGPKRLIEVIDLELGTRQHILRKHADWVTQLAFSHDGVLLASGDRFGSIYLWDVNAGTQFDTTSSHAGAVTALQWSQDSNQLLSAGKDGHVQQWDLQRSSLLNRWLVSSRGIISLSVKDNRTLTLDNERRVMLHDSQGQSQLLTTLENEPTCAVLTGPNADRLIVGDFDAQLHWTSTSTVAAAGKRISLPLRTPTVTVARFAPRPVERQLQLHNSDPKESPDAVKLDHAATLALTRQALSASRAAVEQTKQNLAHLESKISELQRLVDQLESTSK